MANTFQSVPLPRCCIAEALQASSAAVFSEVPLRLASSRLTSSLCSNQLSSHQVPLGASDLLF